MARRKAWTKTKRRRAARKGLRTRRERRQLIAEAQQDPRTQYALLVPFGVWLKDSIKLEPQIAQSVSLKKGKNSTFSVAKVMTGLVLAFEAGILRPSDLDDLALQVKLAESIGLPHFFGETTAGDVLRKSQRRHVLQVRRLLRRLVWQQIDAADTIDINIVGDTTGHLSDSYKREQVAYGYCNGPRQPCLKSGRVVINGLPVYTAVHPGNLNPEDPFVRALALARLCCRLYPQRIVHVSFDSGFASEDHRRQLHALSRRYRNLRFTLSVAPPNPHSVATAIIAQAQAQPARRWRRANRRTRVMEKNWRHLYEDSDSNTRIIVVESTEKPRPQPTPKRKRKRKRPRSPVRYSLIATNWSRTELKAKQVFKQHHQRRTPVEFSIKDGKQSYGLDHLPCTKFESNQMYLALVTLAQALAIIYNRQLLPPARAGSLIATVRHDLWRRPGRVLGPQQIVLDPVYRQLRLIRHLCTAIGLYLGISVVIKRLNTS